MAALLMEALDIITLDVFKCVLLAMKLLKLGDLHIA